MTSNAGSNLNTNSIGFGKQTTDTGKINSALKELFRPEFLNRIDEIVTFNSLTSEELIKIIDLLLKNTENALSNKEIKISVSASAKKYILENGTDLKYGARPLRRAIQKYIEDEIAEMLLRDEIQPGQTVKVDHKKDGLKFTVK
jgi:ATP-dependent Clp protease ATP-binding subunit ClpA